MIHQNSLMASMGLAQSYSEKGYIVQPVPSTVLSELAGIINNPALDRQLLPTLPIYSKDDQDYFETFGQLISSVSQGTLEAPSLHDQMLDGYVHDISNAVLKHIRYAKNVVKPAIMDFVEGVRSTLQNAQIPSASGQFTIEYLELPEVLFDPSFIDLRRAYQGKQAVKPTDVIPLPDKTHEELLALTQTGEKDIDAQILMWYSHKDPAWVYWVWESFFRPKNSIMKGEGERCVPLSFDTVLGMNPFDRADVGLLIYLWSRRLYDEVADGVEGMSLAQYQARIAEMRDFGGGLLDEVVRRVKLFDTGQTIVVDTLPERKILRVYGPVYRAWLDAGGCPEYLFGLMLTGRKVFNKAGIDDLVVELKQRWQSYVLFHNASENNRRFDVFKSIVRDQFETGLSQLMNEEKNFIDRTPNYLETVKQKFYAELQNLKSDSMKDLEQTAMRLLCRSRFYYTDAEKLLTEIQTAADLNPGIDVREAALLATVYYIADYVADQLMVTRG